MNKDILEVKNLTKKFGDFVAVDNISFNVAEGEIVGLLGPNGAGKTTTIMMLLGITEPTGGKISMFGLDFTKHRQEILQKMNYSSAYVQLPWRLKVWEALYVFSQLYSMSDPFPRIGQLIKAFEVEEFRNTLIDDLSAGNRTRVSLCKAFINTPQLVLLDEPTSSLDPDIADKVRQFIKEARDKFKTTLLITSHNMAEVEELCDRVIFINHGQIVDEDTPEGLARKIKTTRVKLMMRDGQKRTVAYCKKHKLPIRQEDRYVTIEILEQSVARMLNELAGLGVDYSEISIDKPTLEDYFITEARLPARKSFASRVAGGQEQHE